MLDYSIMSEDGIVVLRPATPLTTADFAGLSALVDGYLASHARIHGVLIEAESFPGWDSFAGFAAHLRFIRDHERNIDRVALVTDSTAARAAEALAICFVTATIRHFPHAQAAAALTWLKAPRTTPIPDDAQAASGVAH